MAKKVVCTGRALALALIFASPAAPVLAQMGNGGGPGSGMMGPGMMSQGMGQGMMGRGMQGYGTPQTPQAGTGGSSSSGAQVFAAQCAICHSPPANGTAMIGPDLHHIFGRRAGTLPGYPYSAALRQSEVI